MILTPSVRKEIKQTEENQDTFVDSKQHYPADFSPTDSYRMIYPRAAENRLFSDSRGSFT